MRLIQKAVNLEHTKKSTQMNFINRAIKIFLGMFFADKNKLYDDNGNNNNIADKK